MSAHQSRACIRCNQLMVWASEVIVAKVPVNVFHCVICDKYAAEALYSNGVKTVLAPPLVASM